jgi:hypothetical protein
MQRIAYQPGFIISNELGGWPYQHHVPPVGQRTAVLVVSKHAPQALDKQQDFEVPSRVQAVTGVQPATVLLPAMQSAGVREAAAAFGRLNKGVRLGVPKTGAKAKGVSATGKATKGVQKTGAKAKGRKGSQGRAEDRKGSQGRAEDRKGSPGYVQGNGTRQQWIQGGTESGRHWQVAFKHGKVITEGSYATAEEAAQAHDTLRRELGCAQAGFFNVMVCSESCTSMPPN